MRKFPVNVDEEGVILVEHGRCQAARTAGPETVPVPAFSSHGRAKIAFSLADNKIALNADWEMDQLKDLWRELVGAEINFDLKVTGFETAEIDLLVDGPTEPERLHRSDLLPPVRTQAVSRLDDLWHLGDHRLLCADGAWSLPMHPTTFRSTAMSATRARSSIASSPWRPARCRSLSSKPS